MTLTDSDFSDCTHEIQIRESESETETEEFDDNEQPPVTDTDVGAYLYGKNR